MNCFNYQRVSHTSNFFFASDSHSWGHCAVVHSLCDRSVMWSSICSKWTDILLCKHLHIDYGGFMAPVSMLNDFKTFGDLPAWYQLQSSWILVRFSLCGCDKSDFDNDSADPIWNVWENNVSHIILDKRETVGETHRTWNFQYGK